MLNWATYTVDNDGKNFYPTNDIWMTDGYGDYTRHYLRAMAAAPQLAPESSDHLLKTSSVVSKITYQLNLINYTTFDKKSQEIFRLTSLPKKVTVNGTDLKEVADDSNEGWTWQTLDAGGILTVTHTTGNSISIRK
jgi:hypothetical protein